MKIALDPKTKHEPSAGDPIERVISTCDGELYVAQLQMNFTLLAIGQGDFNVFRGDGRLQALRRRPFAAANLFLRREKDSAEPNRRGGHSRFLLDRKEILPNQAIRFKQTDNWTLREIRLSSKDKGDDYIHVFELRDKEWHYRIEMPCEGYGKCQFILASKGALAQDQADFKLTPAAPLLPGRYYALRLSFASPSSPSALEHDEFDFQTFEAFTSTREAERCPNLNVSREYPATFKESDKFVGERLCAEKELVKRNATSPAKKEPPFMLSAQWVGNDIPIAKLEVSASGAPWSSLRIMAIADELLPTTIEKDEKPEEALTRRLLSMGMRESISYWLKVLEWKGRHEALRAWRTDEMKQALFRSCPDNASSTFRENGSELVGQWLQKCNWPEQETAAWLQLLRTSCPASTEQGPCGDALVVDMRSFTVAKALQSRESPLAVILMAEAAPDKVNALAREFRSKFVAVVGAATDGAPQPPKSAEGLTGPVVVFPAELAKKVAIADLSLKSSSPWAVDTARFQQANVEGLRMKLLWTKKELGSQGSDFADCCGGKTGGFIGAALEKDGPVSSPYALWEGATDRDRRHLFRLLLQAMRERGKHAEVAMLPEGFLDTGTLGFLRGLQWLEKHGRTELDNKKRFVLAGIPGVGMDNASTILSKVTSTMIDSKKCEVVEGVVGSAHEYVRWFIKECGAENEKPQVRYEEFTRPVVRRLVVAPDALFHATLTMQALGNLAKDTNGQVRDLGLAENRSKLHNRALEGKDPAVVAAPTRWKGPAGPQKSLNTEALYSEPEIALEELLLQVLLEEESKASSLEARISDYDERPWVLFSVKNLAFDLFKINVRPNFTTATTDSRTKSRDQFQVGSTAEFAFGIYGWKRSWVNSIRLAYIADRINGQGIRNPIEDSYTLRSEFQAPFSPLKGVERQLPDGWKLNYYVAGEFRSQFASPFQLIELIDYQNSSIGNTKTFSDPLFFRGPLDRRVRGEVGLRLDMGKDRWLRVGLAPEWNLNRLLQIQVTSGAVLGVGTPAGLKNALDMVNLQQFQAGQPPAFTPGRANAILVRDRNHEPALAFEFNYRLPLWKPESGKPFTFTSKITESAFYFDREGDGSGQPRFRMVVDNRFAFPLFGNLVLEPGTEFFLYRTKFDPGSPGVQRTFWRLKTYTKLSYSFDWKPEFMPIRKAVRFRNKP